MRHDARLNKQQRAKARLLASQNEVLQDTIRQALNAFDDSQRKRILEAGQRLLERYAEDLRKVEQYEEA